MLEGSEQGRYTMHQTREYADLDLVVSAKDKTGHSIATAEHDVPVVADVKLENLEPQRCTRGSLELLSGSAFL